MNTLYTDQQINLSEAKKTALKFNKQQKTKKFKKVKTFKGYKLIEIC